MVVIVPQPPVEVPTYLEVEKVTALLVARKAIVALESRMKAREAAAFSAEMTRRTTFNRSLWARLFPRLRRDTSHAAVEQALARRHGGDTLEWADDEIQGLLLQSALTDARQVLSRARQPGRSPVKVEKGTWNRLSHYASAK